MANKWDVATSEEGSWTAVIRIGYHARHEAEAKLVAEEAANRVQQHLDEGDLVRITSVDNLDKLHYVAEEAASKLDAARNVLLRLKAEDTWDLARELDRMAHLLREGSLANYDAGHYLDVAKELLHG